MSRKWTLPTLILSLCASGALQPQFPASSFGGLPCNRACQSYMSWSDQALSVRHRGERETTVVVVPAEDRVKQVGRISDSVIRRLVATRADYAIANPPYALYACTRIF